jgi:Putative prokaryotic signal transducing protein
MGTCVNHPNVKALSVCHGCGKPFCESCLVEGKEFYYCKKPSCQELFLKESPPRTLAPQIVCPNCAGELRLSDEDRVSRKFRCPECEALVDFTGPQPVILQKKNYTEIFTSRNQGDIALLKSFLDDSDIDYYIDGEDFLAMYPLIQPVRFFILDDQVEEAKEILKQFDTSAFGVSRRKNPREEG